MYQTVVKSERLDCVFWCSKYILFFISFPDGWAKDDLIYQWKEKDPVQVVPGLHLPRFTLEQYKSAYCDVITNTGKNDFFHIIN